MHRTFIYPIAKQLKDEGHNIETISTFLRLIAVNPQEIHDVICTLFPPRDPVVPFGQPINVERESLQEAFDILKRSPKGIPSIKDFDYEKKGNLFKIQTTNEKLNEFKNLLGGVILDNSLIVEFSIKKGDVEGFYKELIQRMGENGDIDDEAKALKDEEFTIKGVPVTKDSDEKRIAIEDGGIDKVRSSIEEILIGQGFKKNKTRIGFDFINQSLSIKVSFVDELIIITSKI